MSCIIDAILICCFSRLLFIGQAKEKLQQTLISITIIFVKRIQLRLASPGVVWPLPRAGRLGRSWAAAAQGHMVLYVAVQAV